MIDCRSGGLERVGAPQPERRLGIDLVRIVAALALLFAGLGANTRAHAQTPACTLAGPTVRAVWSHATEGAPSARLAAPLRRVADVPLPGGAVRFDYQSLDPDTGRLYVSHMNAGQLVVFDTRARRVLANLEGFPRVTGVLAVPAEGRVYASVPGRHEVAVIDADSLDVVARVGGASFPDGIAYVPAQHRVFVSDESGERELVIDARTNSRMATIALGGEAGNSHYDATSHCVVVAVQTLNQVVFIDPASARIVRRVRLDEAVEAPHGMYIDSAHRLAFVAGEESGTLGVLDLRTLRLTQVVRVGRGPDVLAFDEGLARLYVASESGVVSVFGERAARLTPLGRLRLPHAHTVAVDSTSHAVYLPLENRGDHPVMRIMEAIVTPPS